MSACVNTPLFPSGTAYPCEPVGDCHRRVAPPEACPKTARGRRELQREEPNPRRESAPAGGEAEDALLAIACGGFQPPVFAACLARRFEGPPRWVPRHQLLRRHRERWRQAVGIALGACPLMDVAPPDVHEVLPEAGPGPRAGDTGEGSAGASIPSPHQAGGEGPRRPPPRRPPRGAGGGGRRPPPLALPPLATPGGPGCSVTGSSPARST